MPPPVAKNCASALAGVQDISIELIGEVPICDAVPANSINPPSQPNKEDKAKNEEEQKIPKQSLSIEVLDSAVENRFPAPSISEDYAGIP